MSWLFALWLGCQPKPVEYSVVRGDTLSKIAAAHGVTVDELRSWNGIEGDLIEVGQVLLIHTGEPPQVTSKSSSSKPRKGGSKKSSPSASSSSSGLRMPTPEPCVAFDADPGEEGMVAPGGLDRHQVKPALDAVLPHALECPTEDGTTDLRVVFDITVGCDGVVKSVSVSDEGMASEAWLACAADVLRHADFPAHDMPDGMSFSYPVTVSW